MTTHYGLSLPQSWDGPGAAERRRDHTAIDKAIKAVADSAATRAQMTAAQNRLSALEGRVEVQIGTYTGDGAATRTISLGFTPRAVLVEVENGIRDGSAGLTHGGLALYGHPVIGDYINTIEIVSGGFQIKVNSAARINMTNTKYYYLAFKL